MPEMEWKRAGFDKRAVSDHVLRSSFSLVAGMRDLRGRAWRVGNPLTFLLTCQALPIQEVEHRKAFGSVKALPYRQDVAGSNPASRMGWPAAPKTPPPGHGRCADPVVLHADPWLLVVDKPSGLACRPTC